MDIENNKIVETYDVDKFIFKDFFASHLELPSEELENLHKHYPDFTTKDIVSADNDQDQKIYKHLYKIDEGYSFDHNKNFSLNGFLDTYKKFVNLNSKEYFNEELIYQKKPTLRVMFPNNVAVGGWHRDREYNHPIESINIWVPITSARDTNTIWIESSFDVGDYSPANLDYGQFLFFDSGLKHGNQLNEENKTRISFDFRVVPKSVFKDSQKTSFSQGLDLKLGKYYEETTAHSS